MPRNPQGPVQFHYDGSGKEPTYHCKEYKGRGCDLWVKDPLEKGAWQTIPLFLPGESHGQRSLAGYSPWGCKEWDMTEVT